MIEYESEVEACKRALFTSFCCAYTSSSLVWLPASICSTSLRAVVVIVGIEPNSAIGRYAHVPPSSFDCAVAQKTPRLRAAGTLDHSLCMLCSVSEPSAMQRASARVQ